MSDEIQSIDKVFKSWIPTALGNLSFSLIGRGGDPFPFEKKTFKDSDCIFLEIRQFRIVQDYKIPFLRLLTPFSRQMYLQNAAKLDKYEQIPYYLLVLTGSKDSETRTVQKLTGKVWASDKKLDTEKLDIEGNITEDNFKNYMNEIDNIFRKKANAGFSAELSVNRQGVCKIFALQVKIKKPIEDHDNIKALADQLFHFVKETFHTHKHHNSAEDSITVTHEAKTETKTEAKTEAATGDGRCSAEWTDGVIGDLIRYVLKHRESGDPRVLGVIDYLSSFLDIARKQCQCPSHGNHASGGGRSHLSFRLISPDNLRKSIHASIESYWRILTGKRWAASIFLAVFAIIINLSQYFIHINIYIQNKFILSISTVFIISIILSITLIYGEIFTPKMYAERLLDYWKDLILSLNFNKKITIAITCIFYIVFLCLSAILIYEASEKLKSWFPF